jgi:PII-like signaling protein
LRIFIGEADRYEDKLLYQAIVHLARQKGMVGATVLRGLMGFGAHSRMHTAKILRLSEDLPIVVEIVDRPERIQELWPELDKMIKEGLVTLETIRIIVYRHNVDKH